MGLFWDTILTQCPVRSQSSPIVQFDTKSTQSQNGQLEKIIIVGVGQSSGPQRYHTDSCVIDTQDAYLKSGKAGQIVQRPWSVRDLVIAG